MTDFLFRLGFILSLVLLLCLMFIFREHDRASINARLEAHAEQISQQEWSLAELQALTVPPCTINVLVVRPKEEPQ